MGVPHFYRHVMTRYPQVIRNNLAPRSGDPPGRRCDFLLLDLNCAVHRCAEAVVRDQKAADDVEGAVLSEVVAWIARVATGVCRPAKELFIALDGVPPRAKMVQQRSRRFISALARGANAGTADSLQVWDSCCVTPGTPFMRALCARLHREKGTLQLLVECDVTLTDSTQPGEGEHKIMRRIAEACKDAPQDTFVVYGADADLIMLSMCSPAQNVFVLREDMPPRHAHKTPRGHAAPGPPPPPPPRPLATPSAAATSYGTYPTYTQVRAAPRKCEIATVESTTSRVDYKYVDVRALATRISQAMNAPPKEFVAACVLLGNDFVPALSHLRVREGGVDAIMDAYKQLQRSGPAFRLLEDEGRGIVDHAGLLALVEALGEGEDEGFRSLAAGYEAARMRRMGGPMSQPDDTWAREYEVPGVASIKPGADGWRPRYYAALFPDPGDVAGLADAYISGVAWTLAYYTDSGGPASLSDWYYPHAFSPTALDVANALRLRGGEGLAALAGAALRPGPVTQAATRDEALLLLLVLPPASCGLVPEHARGIMHELDRGCAHYYPTSFRLHTWLRWHVSDCLARLPDVDGARVMRSLEEAVAAVRKARRARPKKADPNVDAPSNAEKS